MLENTTYPLEVLPEVQLSAEQVERLRAIEEYDFWFVIERLAKTGSIAEHCIHQAVTEFKKYMALVALANQDLGMHSNEVDEVWHSFILFTREYSEFCQRACGRMVHHRPNTSRRPQLPELSVPIFQDTYKKFFGPLPAIWFTENKLTLHESETEKWRELEVVAGDCDTGMNPPSVLRAECDAADGCEADAGDCEAMPSDVVVSLATSHPGKASAAIGRGSDIRKQIA